MNDGFSGIHLNKNEAGFFFFLAFPIFALAVVNRSLSRSPIVPAVAVLATGALLAISGAKTTGIAVPFCILMTLLVRAAIFRKSLASALVLLVTIGLVVLAALLVYDVGLAAILSTAFGDSSLTGRDKIWAYALSRFELSPMLGTGYGALWGVGPDLESRLREYGAWIVNQAHSGYIDTAAQLGYVGIFSLAIYLIWTFQRLVRSIGYREEIGVLGLSSYAMYLFFGLVLVNITETTFFRNGHVMFFLPFVISIAATAPRAKIAHLRFAASSAGSQRVLR